MANDSFSLGSDFNVILDSFAEVVVIFSAISSRIALLGFVPVPAEPAVVTEFALFATV